MRQSRQPHDRRLPHRDFQAGAQPGNNILDHHPMLLPFLGIGEQFRGAIDRSRAGQSSCSISLSVPLEVAPPAWRQSFPPRPGRSRRP